MFFCGQRMYICYLFSQGYTYCAKGGWSVGCTSFFHIVKRYTRPLACGLLERRKKKWLVVVVVGAKYISTKPVGEVSHNIQSVAVRRTGRTCFIFGRKSARRFPEFSLFFFYKEFHWFCLLKRGGQLELLCVSCSSPLTIYWKVSDFSHVVCVSSWHTHTEKGIERGRPLYILK